MYAWIGEALIETLRDACDSDWSESAERAWRDAYTKIVESIFAVLGLDEQRR
jgi:hemoglobin-like flavoprotein